MRTWVMEGLGSDEWGVGVPAHDHWVRNAIRVQGQALAQFIVDACNEKEARDEERPLSPHMQAMMAAKGLIPEDAGSTVRIPRFTRISGMVP